MARQFVVVALVFFAVVGLACAAAPLADAPKADPAVNNSDVGDLLAPGAENEIGNTDGAAAPGTSVDDTAGAVVEGPVGAAGDVPAEAPKSGASAVEFSAVATGAAAVAGFFLF